MNKLKKWLALAASLTMALAIALASGCNNMDNSSSSSGDSSSSSSSSSSAPAENTYVVTVIKPNGDPAANLSLNFCLGDNCTPVTTNADGVATFTFDDPSAVYHVEYKMPLESMYTEFGYTDFNTVPGTLTYTMNLTPLS